MPCPTLEPPIALEITISAALFRRMQQLLDANPKLNLDDLASQALSAYLGLPLLEQAQPTLKQP